MTQSENGHYVQANGLDIYYQEYGQGEPLILIHGGILTGESWGPYIAGLAEHYRVITPDTRGHGRTKNSGGKLSFSLLATDVVAFTQALGLEKPLVFGYSDGGQVALEIGMRYPEVARAFVVGGAHFELTAGSRAWVQSILGPADEAEVDFAKFERENAGFAEFMNEAHGADWQALFTQIKPMWNATLNYSDEDFAALVAPTFVFVGDRDDFVPVEDAVKLYRRLPDAEFAVIPHASHTDLIDLPDKAGLLVPMIVDFFKRHTALVE